MLDKKVKYAITSLAFNHNGNLLALSSYSNDEIEVCKIELCTRQKWITH